ncbi:MAG: hypothetical protein CVT92_04610 [Bacteroidetes bacterium HGW-Bacteroidetes-1]|jgi:hypothetical protein|nr:MAG: hypothetical protein CVT92_04610 [Bacteroidetes bacterium HGW-Bacteroidetes-1]
MKTLNILTATILSIFFYSFALADGIKMKEEAYIDDIPFNTIEIFRSIIAHDTNYIFTSEEESYIDDIPFDTEKIAKEHQSIVATEQLFELKDEEYIDDIPFDTEIIVSNYNHKCNEANTTSVTW